MQKKKRTYWVLVQQLEAMRPAGKPRCRWENNIKMYLGK
jgi:hypothetical protein